MIYVLQQKHSCCRKYRFRAGSFLRLPKLVQVLFGCVFHRALRAFMFYRPNLRTHPLIFRLYLVDAKV